jgi:putative transposase
LNKIAITVKMWFKMDKFKNNYRISSARLQNWDYGNSGTYFIPICTENKEYFFGDIKAGVIQLNSLGQLADKF